MATKGFSFEFVCVILSLVLFLDSNAIHRCVATALREDIGPGDATTMAVVPADLQSRAVIRARQSLISCGAQFAQAAFQAVSPQIQVEVIREDGARVEQGENLIIVSGPSRGLLTAERVALNFMQRLSGVATQANRFVEAVRGLPTQILDTRKTTPGWRLFEKYAVRCGGARNHRIGLFDLILIKDNHLAALRDAQPNAIHVGVQRARQAYPHLKMEVEADTLEQVEQALAAGADFVLLDNMGLDALRQAVRLCKGRALTEASGGVNLQTVRGIAETGVDFISAGALTHSAPAVDIALDFE